MITALAAVLLSCSASAAPPPARWYKGNLHTHSLWSDGDELPEKIAGWYRDRGYNFLGLSEHNTLQEGERWVEVSSGTKSRLKTLAESRALLERPGEFILLPNEEITDRFGGLAVHLTATNLSSAVAPRHGGGVVETLQNDVDAVAAQRRETGRPMIVQINHPNFGWSLTASDIASVRGGRFFEVYNPHPEVNTAGDAAHPGAERIWDVALSSRLARPGGEPLYGLAVDDAHNYHASGPKLANPGRGWLMVRASTLTAEALIAALEAGDFYASTGVVLREVKREPGRFAVEIAAEPGVEYRTLYIGTRRGGPAGETFAEVSGSTAAYELKGDELYVRAKVVSTKPKANATLAGEVEQAWTQPLIRP